MCMSMLGAFAVARLLSVTIMRETDGMAARLLFNC